MQDRDVMLQSIQNKALVKGTNKARFKLLKPKEFLASVWLCEDLCSVKCTKAVNGNP